MKVLIDNAIVDAAAVLTATSQVGNLPAVNVQDVHPTKVWRAATVTTERLTIDAGAADAADAFAIVGHNLQAAATVTLEANTTDSWGSPPFSTTLVPSVGLPTLKTFTSQSFRWWRLTLTDATNPDGYVELGRLMIGTMADLSFQGRGVSVPWTDERPRADKQSVSLGGELYTDIGEEMAAYAFEFRWVDTTHRNLIRSTFRTVGRHTPFMFTLFDPPDVDVLGPDYVVLANDLASEHHGHGRFTMGVQLRSARGINVT